MYSHYLQHTQKCKFLNGKIQKVAPPSQGGEETQSYTHFHICPLKFKPPHIYSPSYVPIGERELQREMCFRTSK